MAPAPTALPCPIMVVDVESYGDPTRTDLHRVTVREGVYDVVEAAFKEADIPWAECFTSDSGDGLLVVLPPTVPKIVLVDRLPARLNSGLLRHNEIHAAGARIRFRVALHTGEVRRDAHGVVGEAVNFTFRIADARDAKRALKESTAHIVLIVSDTFYQSVVVHDPAAEPAAFHEIDVAVKETRTTAWVRLVGEHGPATATPPRERDQRGGAAELPLTALGELVDVLINMPGFITREDRDLVLQQLDPNVRASIARYPNTRADITSIVRTCRHYDGAWPHLVEAIRFFADGTNEMRELDTLRAKIEQG
jgi:effector-associated domain 2 (EAD2)-containing protein